jgi:hypothetical protein
MANLGSAIGAALVGQGIAAGLDLAGDTLNAAGYGGFIDIIPTGSLGSISIQATFEERLTDTIQITEHPVESGVQVSDHAYVRNPEVTIRCGWSNSNGFLGALGELEGIASAVNQQLNGAGLDFGALTADSYPSVGGYVSGIYQQLQDLQQSLRPFTIATTIRTYLNMMMTSLSVTRDQKTSQALMVTAVCRQIKMVSTSSATLPPANNMANPTNSDTVDSGVQTAVPASGINSSGAYDPNGIFPSS